MLLISAWPLPQGHIANVMTFPLTDVGSNHEMYPDSESPLCSPSPFHDISLICGWLQLQLAKVRQVTQSVSLFRRPRKHAHSWRSHRHLGRVVPRQVAIVFAWWIALPSNWRANASLMHCRAIHSAYPTTAEKSPAPPYLAAMDTPLATIGEMDPESEHRRRKTGPQHGSRPSLVPILRPSSYTIRLQGHTPLPGPHSSLDLRLALLLRGK